MTITLFHSNNVNNIFRKHVVLRKFDSIIVVFFLSCEAILVDDISNDTVVLLAPSQDSEVPNGDIQFNWQLLEEADSYQIQIASPNFQSASQILLDSIVESNSVQKNLQAGTYEWRLKAINEEYETGYSRAGFTVNP